MEKNPLIEPEDFFAPYREKIEALQNNPQAIEFDKLTYELFTRNEQGKKWLEIMKERYLIPTVMPGTQIPFELGLVWGDGFKECIRRIITSIKAHDQKILSGQIK